MRTRTHDTVRAPIVGCIGEYALGSLRGSTGLRPGNGLASSEAGGVPVAVARGITAPRLGKVARRANRSTYPMAVFVAASVILLAGAGPAVADGEGWWDEAKQKARTAAESASAAKERIKEETAPWRDKAGAAAAAGREMIQEGGEAARDGVRRATEATRAAREYVDDHGGEWGDDVAETLETGREFVRQSAEVARDGADLARETARAARERADDSRQ